MEGGACVAALGAEDGGREDVSKEEDGEEEVEAEVTCVLVLLATACALPGSVLAFPSKSTAARLVAREWLRGRESGVSEKHACECPSYNLESAVPWTMISCTQ